MSKTIKELADTLGVSKTAVRKYMTPEFREAHTETKDGNLIVIDEDGCREIAETIKKPPETTTNQFPETPENDGLREEIAFLRAQMEAKDRQLEAQARQLEQKDKQLEAKDAQITGLTAALENTTASLKAAQALHAGTIQTQLLPEASETEPETIDADRKPAETKKKTGFFARLFGWEE